MELEGGGDAELVDESGHFLGVCFEGDEGGGALGGVWVCGVGHDVW